MRYSDQELELIKTTFSENDELLIALRKHFLQMDMDAVEQALIIGFKNNEQGLKIISKTFLPELDGNAPFSQVIDLWMTVELKGKDPKDAYNDLIAREKLITYLAQRLKVLSGGVPSVDNIQFSELTKIGGKTKAEETYSNFVMRNTLIYHIEQQLSMLSILAGQKNESVEQTKERLRKDSVK